MRTKTHYRSPLCGSGQNVGGSDGGAERASRDFANSADVVSAAGRTRRNFTFAVEFDVRRQVAGEIDAVAIGQVIFQSKLICGGVNLAKIVDASIAGRGVWLFYEIKSCEQYQTNESTNNNCPIKQVGYEHIFFSSRETHVISKHRPANSVAGIYLLRPPGAKW